MKTLLPFLLLPCIFLSVSCGKSPEEKAKSLIKEELRTTLHDFKSYEPVTYGKIDSSFTSWVDLPEFENNDIKREVYSKQMKDYGEKALSYAGLIYSQSSYKLCLKYMEEAKDSAIVYSQRNMHIIETFKVKFKGYQMQHSYRAKSLSGNLGIHHHMYYFDSSFTKIIGQKDISESSEKKL
jgi:hypothetical protein